MCQAMWSYAYSAGVCLKSSDPTTSTSYELVVCILRRMLVKKIFHRLNILRILVENWRGYSLVQVRQVLFSIAVWTQKEDSLKP